MNVDQILDFVRNNVEPWQLGVALLALAAGKWAFRLLRFVVSFRLLLASVGGVVMYPYLRPFIDKAQEGQLTKDDWTLLAVGGAVTFMVVYSRWLNSHLGGQPQPLSPDAQKVMDALGKLKLGDLDFWGKLSKFEHKTVISNGKLRVDYDWPRWSVMVNGLHLHQILASKSEQKQIQKRASEVYQLLAAEKVSKERQNALDSLT